MSDTAPRWLTAIAAIAVVVFLLGRFSGEIFDPDFWWHLRTGQYLIERHRLPVPDPFSYTTATAGAGYPGEERTRDFNLTHEWLAQAAGYQLYAKTGFGGIVWARALLVTLSCLCAGWMAQRRTGSWWWGLAAALAASSVARMFATDRPDLISYLLVVVFALCLESRRALWLLPLISLIWANCHGGFFLGWVICAAYCVEAMVRRSRVPASTICNNSSSRISKPDLFQRTQKRRRLRHEKEAPMAVQRDPTPRRLLLVSCLTVAASGLNPNGFGIIPTLLRYHQSVMTSHNLEWRHAQLWGLPYGYDILLYLSVPVLALAWRRVRLADWLLFVFFAYASLTAFRNEIYFGLFAPIWIAAYFPTQLRFAPVLRYAAVAAVIAGTAYGTTSSGYFRAVAGEWRYPSGAVRFLREHHLDGPLFNTYMIGGYLIWKGERPFVDGRALSETVYQDYERVVYGPAFDPSRPKVLDRYGVQTILMDSFEYFTGKIYPLVAVLAADPAMLEWKLVYEDQQSMVFRRNVPAGMADLGRKRISDHVERECRLLLANDPQYPGCAKSLADLFRAGNPARAQRMLQLYLEYGGRDVELN